MYVFLIINVMVSENHGWGILHRYFLEHVSDADTLSALCQSRTPTPHCESSPHVFI